MTGPSPLRDGVDGVDGIYLPEAMAQRAVKQALNDWRQGDLVYGVRLFWAAPVDDELTGLSVEDPGDGRWAVISWDGAPATAESASGTGEATGDGSPSWGIITSQTCDVVATGPGQRHPTVQVSPLLELTATFDAGTVTEIRRGARVDLVHVPDVPTPGEWAADLRISLPVSKAVLLRQPRVHGFREQNQTLEFAERVAAKTRRPALHDAIADGLVPRLRELIGTARATGEDWPDLIEQLRVLVTAGDRLHPKDICLLAVTHLGRRDIDPADRAPLRKWRTAEAKRLKRASDGITLGPIRFRQVDELSVREYRDSSPLRVPELGGPAYW